MGHEIKLIGDFLNRHRDTPPNPWDPINDKSPLESGPNPDLDLHPRQNTVQADVAAADVQLSKIMRDIDQKGTYVDFTTGPGTQAFNPSLYAKSISRLGAHLGKTGLALFAGTQLGLFLLNRHGKIWNPATMIPVPILQNFVPAALDVLTGTPRVLTGYDDSQSGLDFYSKNHGEGGQDIHADMAKGQYNEVRIVHYPPFIEAITAGGAGGPPQGGLGSHLGAMSQITSLVDNPFEVPLGKPLVAEALETRNKYTPDRTYSEKATYIVDDLVKDVLTLSGKTKHFATDIDSELLVYSRAATDTLGPPGPLSKIGSTAKLLLGKRNVNAGEQRPDVNEVRDKGTPVSETGLARSSFIRGIIPAKFRGENDFGFITTPAGRSPTEIISDTEAYVPLSLTDLRSVGDTNSYRTIYLRPLNVKIAESFTPQWNKAQYFGRTDPVATYEATGRAFSISFSLIAFGPEDLRTIYQKLNWLTSMVYPTYDKNLLYVAGPVVRMRVGDIMNAVGPEGARGLPGIIESLDFDYNEGPWELEEGLKVPRNIGVSLSFTVLHDRPIGLGAEGKFGGLGTIKDGKFFPPGLNPAQGAGSNDGEKLPDVSTTDSFRSLKGVKDPNGYPSFRDTNAFKDTK